MIRDFAFFVVIDDFYQTYHAWQKLQIWIKFKISVDFLQDFSFTLKYINDD